MSTLLETVEIETGPTPRAAVVWLHGLGADGNDFVPLVPELELAVPTRFVFPHAPVRPVTINGGRPMRAWYDIRGFDARAREDEAGLNASAAQIAALLERETARGIASTDVVLAGFSQGGALALHWGLRAPQPLGGILALSTYLPLAAALAAQASLANAATPIFMAHGDADPIVPLELALGSVRALETAGYALEWHRYPMGHAVCPDEIRDLNRWLCKRQQVRR